MKTENKDDKEEKFIQLVGESAAYESAGIVWRMLSAEERERKRGAVADVLEKIAEHCLSLGELLHEYAKLERESGENGEKEEVTSGPCAN